MCNLSHFVSRLGNLREVFRFFVLFVCVCVCFMNTVIFLCTECKVAQSLGLLVGNLAYGRYRTWVPVRQTCGGVGSRPSGYGVFTCVRAYVEGGWGGGQCLCRSMNITIMLHFVVASDAEGDL